MTYLLALDQGTSSSRSIVFDERGHIVAQAQLELPQIYPRPGWVEHDPMEIWRTQLDCARQAGYACVLLDTLDDMESARALYADLGFEEIPPYYQSPIAGAHYLKVEID